MYVISKAYGNRCSMKCALYSLLKIVNLKLYLVIVGVGQSNFYFVHIKNIITADVDTYLRV